MPGSNVVSDGKWPLDQSIAKLYALVIIAEVRDHRQAQTTEDYRAEYADKERYYMSMC